MAEKEIVIKTQGLTKRYGELTAVDHLDLELSEGEVFGLLGPNGAGKTTTILMLLGLTEPTEGTVLVAGKDPRREPLAVKRQVGYLPDNVGFYEDLTGRENLRYTARLNGLSGPEAEERISFLLERVGLADVADHRVGTYSRGMRQRLGIADALVKDPKIVILDEPTLGIDPEGTQEMLSLIRCLSREDGRTVLISSHLLHQVQQICDRVGIFVQGKLLAAGPIETLGRQVLGDEPRTLEVRAEPDDERLLRVIAALPGVEAVARSAGLLLVTCRNDLRAALSRTLVQEGFALLHLRERGGDLDDIYRRYFAREGVI